MHVVATAGHVDHGKSRLVRALTGMEPDRWAEERRRGMTIDLGFAWTALPSGAEVAFVDVPGHERFVSNMLAGVGAVPAVLLVVAADEGWQPQTAEHVGALDALGVAEGLLVVTKTDLADADPVIDDVRRRLARTTLAQLPAVAVSAETGAGMHDLVAAIDAMVTRLAAGDAAAVTRLWVDRSFTIRGVGTVVTGTLPAGTLRVGDEVEIAPPGRTATVRALESLKQSVESVTAVARVAVNLRGVDRDAVRRGCALVTPDAWTMTATVDLVLTAAATDAVPEHTVAHIGSAAIPARLRPLGAAAMRVRLSSPLPLHFGDRLLLRDPARHVIVAAGDVADLAPLPLRRRGAPAAVGAALRVPRTGDELLARAGAVRAAELHRSGLARPATAADLAGWYVATDRWADWRARIVAAVDIAGAAGVAVADLVAEIGIGDAALVRAAAKAEALALDEGRVRRPGTVAPLHPAVVELADRLAVDPFAAPERDVVMRLGRAALGDAIRRGLLLRLAEDVYVGPKAVDVALDRLAALPQPFTVGDARSALGSSRRVVVPLLEHLDAQRHTRRQSDGTRLLVRGPG